MTWKRALAAICLCIAQAMPAQDRPLWGSWGDGPDEFNEYSAFAMELVGDRVDQINVFCAADRAYITIDTPSVSPDDELNTAQIRVAGRSWQLEARKLENIWWLRPPASLIDALRTGTRLDMQVAGTSRTFFRLNGSRAAIDAALRGCGQGTGYNRQWTNAYRWTCWKQTGPRSREGYPCDIAPAQQKRGLATQAHTMSNAPAGPKPRATSASAPPLPGGVESKFGCPSLDPVYAQQLDGKSAEARSPIFCGDFTGDGAPDALAQLLYQSGGNALFSRVMLFRNDGKGGLHFLRHVPEFYGHPVYARFERNSVFVSMIIMRSGDSRCCPSGQEVRKIDTTSGRHKPIAP